MNEKLVCRALKVQCKAKGGKDQKEAQSYMYLSVLNLINLFAAFGVYLKMAITL